MHLTKEIMIADDGLLTFIQRRLENKNTEKEFDKKNNFFYLVPVVWTTIKSLKVLADFCKKHTFILPNALPLFALLPFTNQVDDEIMFRFGPISEIFGFEGST